LYFFSTVFRTAGDEVAVAVVISAASKRVLVTTAECPLVDGAGVPTACSKALKGGLCEVGWRID
jgi:hypothetical protein